MENKNNNVGDENAQPAVQQPMTRPEHNPADKYCECRDCSIRRAGHILAWMGSGGEGFKDE